MFFSSVFPEGFCEVFLLRSGGFGGHFGNNFWWHLGNTNAFLEFGGTLDFERQYHVFCTFKAPGHPERRQKHAKKCHRNSMQKLMSKSIVSELFCLILGCPWTSIWGPRGHPKNVIMISVLWIGVCTLLGVLGGTPKMQMRTFFFKNHVFCEGDFQNLAFRLRAGPKEPKKYTKRTLKRHPE